MTRRWPPVDLLLPLLAAVSTYAGSIGNPLLYDDARALALMDAGTGPSVWPPTHGRTLTWALFHAQHGLWGDWAPGYHLVSVAFHGVASLLASVLARSLTGSRLSALCCGLLFAVHPVHSEVVLSFANNKDSLAFVLMALAAIAWRRSAGWDRWYAASLVCYALAMFSKEVAAATLPALLFVHDVVLGGGPKGGGRRAGAAARRVLPFAALGAALGLFFLASRSLEGLGGAMEAIFTESNGRLRTPKDVFLASLGAMPDQVRLLAWPSTLSADYPAPSAPDGGSLSAVLGAALWIAGTSLVAVLARRRPVASFGIAWTLVLYLPAANLLPLIHHFVAERYLYAPSFGVCLVVGAWFSRTRSVDAVRTTRHTALSFAPALLVAAVVLLGAVRSISRVRDWSSQERLWTAVLDAGLHTPRAHNALGALHAERGEFHEAIEHYRRSATLVNSDEAQCNLGEIYLRAGRREAARRHLQQTLAGNPHHRRAAALLRELERQDG